MGSVDSICSSCQAKLRVSDEFAGQQARCPNCGEVYTVPAVGEKVDSHLPNVAPNPPAVATATPPTWYMRTQDQRVFGPVTRHQLDDWARQGRINVNCQIREEDNSWVPASTIFPQLLRPEVGNPFPNPATTPPGSNISEKQWVVAHRGGLILGLGLAGFIIGCPLLSIMAWVMGNGDLAQIRSGYMDPSGQSLTQVGRILGIIATVIWIVSLLVVFAVFIFMALAAAGGNF